MTREDRFVAILSKLESDNNPHAWGDSGRAAGEFQIHPSMYADWGPDPEDFGEEERTWAWAFEFAVRSFHQYALRNRPEASDLEIAMAFHLHGQLVWSDWDQPYANKWYAATDFVDHRGA